MIRSGVEGGARGHLPLQEEGPAVVVQRGVGSATPSVKGCMLGNMASASPADPPPEGDDEFMVGSIGSLFGVRVVQQVFFGQFELRCIFLL